MPSCSSRLPTQGILHATISRREHVMQAETIAGKAKIVVNAQTTPTEVILPYRVYQDLKRLKMRREIYQQTDIQAAPRKAG